MTKILALDLGTSTGWATGPSFISGVWNGKGSRYEGGGMRYLRFRAWLDEMLAMLGCIDVVFYEEVRAHKGVDAAHVYGGLLAQLTAWCEEKKIPYEGIPVATIKRHATGKGNSGKELMKKAASERVGRVFTDDNEADAVCILFCGMSMRLSSCAIDVTPLVQRTQVIKRVEIKR